MEIIKEFKAFAVKGNVIDLAVGVIIGGSFGKIVTSLVNDIIMPPIGLLLGGFDFKQLKIVLKDANVDELGKQIPEVAIGIGSFIQQTVDFTIVAASIFLILKIIKTAKKDQKVEAEAPTISSTDKILLEIKEILNKNNKSL